MLEAVLLSLIGANVNVGKKFHQVNVIVWGKYFFQMIENMLLVLSVGNAWNGYRFQKIAASSQIDSSYLPKQPASVILYSTC